MKNQPLKETNIPFVSVIVPVYNDAQRIGKCIEALLNQTYTNDKYEVIIIDNGSTDETRTVIKKYPVKLLIEDKIQSSYAARNKGIKNTRGEIIAFTDSDCIPNADWIEKGVANLLSVPNCGLVGGEINVFFKNSGKPNAVELYDSIMGFNQREDIERHNFGSTANVFTFKNIFDNVGLFDDELKSGGDNEWGRRVFAYGYKHIYANDTIVAHPARNSLRQMHQRTTRLIGGCYDQYWKNSYKAYVKQLLRSIKTILSLLTRITLGMYPADRLKGAKRKIQFMLVVCFVQIVSTWERTRLIIGGRSKR